MYEFTGRVTEVCAVQTFSSGFTKRELLVREESGERPRTIPFNFKRDDISRLDGVSAGDRVTVHFALDGRDWTDPRTNKVRHFCDLVGISVDVLASAGDTTPAPVETDSNDSDMPF